MAENLSRVVDFAQELMNDISDEKQLTKEESEVVAKFAVDLGHFGATFQVMAELLLQKITPHLDKYKDDDDEGKKATNNEEKKTEVGEAAANSVCNICNNK